MNLPSNLAKSSLLATAIFWIIGGVEEFNSISLISIIFLSYIPIFISCLIAIVGTICPIFWLTETGSFGKQDVFKMYFPYYCIICFSLCCYGIYSISIEPIFIGFFISAFITTMQSWIWFAKEPSV
ncbi:MAG: hypothetical protein ACSHXF_09290 [Aquaticitalea sp.]